MTAAFGGSDRSQLDFFKNEPRHKCRFCGYPCEDATMLHNHVLEEHKHDMVYDRAMERCVPNGFSSLRSFSDMENNYVIAPHKNKSYLGCDHGVTFNAEQASGLSADEVRTRWPRLDGYCPKGCGYFGLAYASYRHYIAGDW